MSVTKTAIKSITNKSIEVKTTAEFEASPTPTVPLLQLYPLKHPTNPMAKPKKNDFMIAGLISEYSKASKTLLKNKRKETSPLKYSISADPNKAIASP